MELLDEVFGHGRDLNALQMTCRGVVVFIIALALIRTSGRRSFGIRSPLDNIILILLGAILSRAVVGASAFIPVIVCCFGIVIMHRVLGWLIVNNNTFAKFIEGNKILLFEKGAFIKENLSKGLVCEEDVMQGIRKAALTDDLDKIDRIYIERSGDISPIKKQ